MENIASKLLDKLTALENWFAQRQGGHLFAVPEDGQDYPYGFGTSTQTPQTVPMLRCEEKLSDDTSVAEEAQAALGRVPGPLRRCCIYLPEDDTVSPPPGMLESRKQCIRW